MFCIFNNYLNTDNGLKDNFYLTINKDIIDSIKLEDKYSWSYFIEAQDNVDEDVSLIVKDILDDNNNILSKKEISTIKSIYDKAINIDKRNKDGIKDLDIYINKVWKVDNVGKLVDVIILIENELGIDLISNIEVLNDYKDNSRNIIYLTPVTYLFGSNSDYMANDDYMAYKAYIRRACVQLWKAYGYSDKEARNVAEEVFKFYEGVSSVSKLSSELEDIESYYNIVSEEDIKGLYSNVGKYLYRRGISGKVYSLVDRSQYKYLNDSLTSDNIEVWKYIIITKILSSYASYGSSDYIEIVNNLNDAIMGGNKDKEKDDEALDIVKGLFTSEIDKVYQSRYLDSDKVKDIEEMFFSIKSTFRERVKNNEWLSENAKNAAIKKLDEMKIIIGSGNGNGYDIANKLNISNSSLISDVINMKKVVMNDELSRLDNGEKRNLVSETTVNAYYQPLDNSIVIPVAFFELIDEYDSYYERLGAVGMIIAHEVTHAFDGNGSKFDEIGNLNDWWSEEDMKEFERLKGKVSDYYSKYEVIDGKYINGEKTVNENIADLGALECIMDIAGKKGASDDEFKVMMESFARVWASKEIDKYMELLLLQDVHSPNQFRVNAVLSSMDEFYKIYKINIWNNMWVSKNDRVSVW